VLELKGEDSEQNQASAWRSLLGSARPGEFGVRITRFSMTG
jgi:hypothetical protein